MAQVNILGLSTETRPIVLQDDPSIVIGRMITLQSNVWGTPLGILLSITRTPKYGLAVKTDHGIKLLDQQIY